MDAYTSVSVMNSCCTPSSLVITVSATQMIRKAEVIAQALDAELESCKAVTDARNTVKVPRADDVVLRIPSGGKFVPHPELMRRRLVVASTGRTLPRRHVFLPRRSRPVERLTHEAGTCRQVDASRRRRHVETAFDVFRRGRRCRSGQVTLYRGSNRSHTHATS